VRRAPTHPLPLVHELSPRLFVRSFDRRRLSCDLISRVSRDRVEKHFDCNCYQNCVRCVFGNVSLCPPFVFSEALPSPAPASGGCFIIQDAEGRKRGEEHAEYEIARRKFDRYELHWLISRSRLSRSIDRVNFAPLAKATCVISIAYFIVPASDLPCTSVPHAARETYFLSRSLLPSVPEYQISLRRKRLHPFRA